MFEITDRIFQVAETTSLYKTFLYSKNNSIKRISIVIMRLKIFLEINVIDFILIQVPVEEIVIIPKLLEKTARRFWARQFWP